MLRDFQTGRPDSDAAWRCTSWHFLIQPATSPQILRRLTDDQRQGRPYFARWCLRRASYGTRLSDNLTPVKHAVRQFGEGLLLLFCFASVRSRRRFERAQSLGGIAMQCVALDIGSSTIKGAVLDVARRSVGHITTSPFPARRAGLPDRYFEVDPQEIEDAARRVIESLLVQAPDAERLYVAGQMGGLLLLDQRGQPLANYLSWQDQRTQAGDDQTDTFLARRARAAGRR